MLSEKDIQFIEKRRWFARKWNLVGSLLLVCLGILFFWLFIKSPNLVNPYYVISGIKEGTIEQETLTLMAVMLPVVTLMCFAIMIIVLLFGFAIFTNEKHYLRIIDRFYPLKNQNSISAKNDK